MKKTPFLLLLILFNCWPAYAEWKPNQDENEIKTFYEPADNDYVRIASSAHISANIDYVMALFMDIKRCNEWIYLCNSATLLKNDNNNELYAYQTFDFPFPFKDRDIIIHATITSFPETQSFYIHVTSEVNVCDKIIVNGCDITQRGEYIRMHSLDAVYAVKASSEGGVDIYWEQYINPGGETSFGIANDELKKLPFETLSNMKKILENGKD